MSIDLQRIYCAPQSLVPTAVVESKIVSGIEVFLVKFSNERKIWQRLDDTTKKIAHLVEEYKSAREDAPKKKKRTPSKQPPKSRGYYVEGIEAKRMNGGAVEYLTKWRDYPSSDNTWLQRSNFRDPCTVDHFEAQLATEQWREDIAKKLAEDEFDADWYDACARATAATRGATDSVASGGAVGGGGAASGAATSMLSPRGSTGVVGAGAGRVTGGAGGAGRVAGVDGDAGRVGGVGGVLGGGGALGGSVGGALGFVGGGVTGGAGGGARGERRALRSNGAVQYYED